MAALGKGVFHGLLGIRAAGKEGGQSIRQPGQGKAVQCVPGQGQLFQGSAQGLPAGFLSHDQSQHQQGKGKRPGNHQANNADDPGGGNVGIGGGRQAPGQAVVHPPEHGQHPEYQNSQHRAHHAKQGRGIGQGGAHFLLHFLLTAVVVGKPLQALV